MNSLTFVMYTEVGTVYNKCSTNTSPFWLILLMYFLATGYASALEHGRFAQEQENSILSNVYTSKKASIFDNKQ